MENPQFSDMAVDKSAKGTCKTSQGMQNIKTLAKKATAHPAAS